MNQIPFVDISYAQGLYDMAANTDSMVMMKASGYYTGSLGTSFVINSSSATDTSTVGYLIIN